MAMPTQTGEGGDVAPLSKLRPRVADAATILRLRQLEEEWPKGLVRFDLFKHRDDETARYRAICWNPIDRQLHVLKLVAKGSPEGPGDWSAWSADAPDSPLRGIRRIEENVVPAYMKLPLDMLPDSLRKARNGFARRLQILQAFCMLDVGGNGNPADFVFNDLVVTDRAARLEALDFVISALRVQRGYSSYIQKLFHQHCHFNGHENSMLAQHSEKGKTGPRPNLVNKPGALTKEELRDKLKCEATGKPRKLRRKPVSDEDRAKFLGVLERYWVKKGWPFTKTYNQLIKEHYAGVDERLNPTYETFCRVANENLIPLHNLLTRRNGSNIHQKHFAPLSGTATDYTQGKFETVDVDGWVPKVGVRVKVQRRWKNISVRVLFAVSRNSRAVLGIEPILTGENAIAYRRCIASCYLDKSRIATEFNLASSDGLLHGNIDGVFVDNGAGPSKDNIRIACSVMRLWFETAPPASGQKKSVVESLNELMVQALVDSPSGYTRKKDPLSTEKRRKAILTRGVSLRQFLASLYEAVRQHNLTAYRPRLRNHEDFIEGAASTPKDIFVSQQAERRGDARRQWSEREILSRFIDWESRTVRCGLVHFHGLRYESAPLKVLAEKHAGLRREAREKLVVLVKRFTADPHHLIWKHTLEDEEKLLTIIPEDIRRVQNLSWQEFYLTQHADTVLKNESESKRRKSKRRVTAEQHKVIAEAERTRAANGDIHDLAGTSVANAKALGIIQHERAWGEREAAALGFEKRNAMPAVPAPPQVSSSVNDSYAARYRARKAASKEAKAESPER
ncbi:hypothetical protein [Burkholderia ubonensis]|uniref:hypothetical protein n=1 Tax=Burkholderia ubonensis TaxID=101571 RepID=UPI0012FC52CA|nr:hypothetical protein [Burkholderia ubonensis]